MSHVRVSFGTDLDTKRVQNGSKIGCKKSSRKQHATKDQKRLKKGRAINGNVNSREVPRSRLAPRPCLGDYPKMTPRWPQDGPKRIQDGPKRAQDGPKRAQNAPKRAQDGCQRAQKRLQDNPRWLQKTSGWSQKIPRWTKRRSKMHKTCEFPDLKNVEFSLVFQ